MDLNVCFLLPDRGLKCKCAILPLDILAKARQGDKNWDTRVVPSIDRGDPLCHKPKNQVKG